MKVLLSTLLLLMILIPLTAQDDSPPTVVLPIQIVEGQYGQAAVYQEIIPQGRAGLLRVIGANINEIQVVAFDQALTFFSPNEGTYYAVFAVPIEQKTRAYEVPVILITKQGQSETLTLTITVDNGGFLTQDVLLVGEKAFLVNPDTENGELTHLFELAAPVTEEQLWDANGFRSPVQGELTSPFGAVRVFNNNFNTLHTGWDYQVGVGQPVSAAAAGVVAFAGPLDIRGNYVLIDHGYGIYTGYAHFSVIYVTQGQHVSAGQIVGQVGTTGRSSSPHAHFEMLVNDEWVDPVDFLRLPLPR
jgi:murein DD-endopeptidase MepM/ murein hydrolase activator NlpD